MINCGWDGSGHSVDRRSSESFSVPNVRLTTSIMLQMVAFEKFLKSKGEEARGLGFLARQLICFPVSTQGYRFIGQDELPWDYVTKFKDRIAAIYNMHPILVDNLNQRKVLEFSTEAKSIWLNFYNENEGLMQNGFWLCDVKDYASKVAENTARIAALFHFFQGAEGDISKDTMNNAIEVVRWFVVEFKRLFGSTPPIPQEQQDALLLENWLHHQAAIYNNNMFLKNKILQYGPNSLRNRERLNTALDYLAFNGRVLFQRDKNRTFVILNRNR